MNLRDFQEFDSSQQLEKWDSIKNSLSLAEKEQIVDDILGEDIWGYIELISRILFDIAIATDKYVQMLENVTTRVKEDMAQGPFLKALVGIGAEKKDMAVELREKILSRGKDESLMVMSGLLLGGIGLNDEKFVLDLIETNLDKEINPLILQSFVKALLVMDEKKDRIEKQHLRIIEKLLRKMIKDLNMQIIDYSLRNFSKQELFFYRIIKSLVCQHENDYKWLVFRTLCYNQNMSQQKVFELIELSKDAYENVLNEIVMCLRKYPSEKKKILNLCFYWINKGIYFKIRNLSWLLEQIMKKDQTFLSLFMKSFRKIKQEHASVIIPHIFGELAKHDVDLSLSEAIKVKTKNSNERWIKQQLLKQIIGCCYTEKKNLPHIQKLATYFINESKEKSYISVKIKPDLLNATTLDKPTYDVLVDKVSRLVDDVLIAKKTFNYAIIYKNLSKYKFVKKYGKDVVDKCKRQKKDSPLLGLLEREVPTNKVVTVNKEDSDLVKAMKVLFFTDQFWPRAYLKELDSGLQLFENIKNGKYATYTKKKDYIQNELISEDKFWNFFSELLVMNRIGKRRIKCKDVVIGNNDIDLEAKLLDKIVLLEVTAPDLDRNLRLSNKAVELKNKALSVITKKYEQIMKSGAQTDLKYKDGFYFYIIIDTSNSRMDEFQLLNTLFGSLTVNWSIDRKTGRTLKTFSTRAPDSLYHKNKRTEIVSGVIYFKRDLVLDERQNPFIKLNGDIINNPMARMALSKTKIVQLKRVLFNTRVESEAQGS